MPGDLPLGNPFESHVVLLSDKLDRDATLHPNLFGRLATSEKRGRYASTESEPTPVDSFVRLAAAMIMMPTTGLTHITFSQSVIGAQTAVRHTREFGRHPTHTTKHE